MSSGNSSFDSLLELEESIAGKPGGPWITSSNNAQFSLIAISLALTFGIAGGMLDVLPNGFYELVAKAESGGASPLYAQIYGAISAIAIIFAWWVTLTAAIKWITPASPEFSSITQATARLGKGSGGFPGACERPGFTN